MVQVVLTEPADPAVCHHVPRGIQAASDDPPGMLPGCAVRGACHSVGVPDVDDPLAVLERAGQVQETEPPGGVGSAARDQRLGQAVCGGEVRVFDGDPNGLAVDGQDLEAHRPGRTVGSVVQHLDHVAVGQLGEVSCVEGRQGEGGVCVKGGQYTLELVGGGGACGQDEGDGEDQDHDTEVARWSGRDRRHLAGGTGLRFIAQSASLVPAIE